MFRLASLALLLSLVVGSLAICCSSGLDVRWLNYCGLPDPGDYVDPMICADGSYSSTCCGGFLGTASNCDAFCCESVSRGRFRCLLMLACSCDYDQCKPINCAGIATALQGVYLGYPSWSSPPGKRALPDGLQVFKRTEQRNGTCRGQVHSIFDGGPPRCSMPPLLIVSQPTTTGKCPGLNISPSSASAGPTSAQRASTMPWSGSTCAWCVPCTPRVRSCFLSFDVDGDGYLTLEESAKRSSRVAGRSPLAIWPLIVCGLAQPRNLRSDSRKW
jgi:hypothetical protein